MSSPFLADPAATAPFRADKMGKSTLFDGGSMMVGLNAFEPGQEHALHAHEGMDKLYYVLQGGGRFQVGDESRDVEAGALVIAAAGVPHGVVNDRPQRLVVLAVLAPPPSQT